MVLTNNKNDLKLWLPIGPVKYGNLWPKLAWPVLKKIMILKKLALKFFLIGFIYKLFQMCSIQIDLGTCLNRGYMILLI